MKLYLSGPMRGIPAFNFPLFDAVSAALREQGHEVWSPADHDREVWPEIETAHPGFATGTEVEDSGAPYSFTELLKADIVAVTESDGIALLPGWERSSGAAIELGVARDVRIKVFYVVDADGRWILEEEPPTTIIGLSGYAQAGKDTAGAALVEHLGFERVSFADALRDMLYALDPWVAGPGVGPMGDPLWSLKRLVDQHGWEKAKAVESAYPHHATRAYLQRLGTEAGRQVLGDDIWVRTAMAKVKPGGRYVFTDVRFPNEAAAIEKAGGQVWRITRHGSDPVNAHPSETALDGHKFHTVISNTGEDLAGFQRLVVANARVHL